MKRRRCHYSRTNRQLSMVLRRRWGWWGGESMRPSRRIISLVTATAGNNILMSTFVHIKMLGYRYLHARNANRNLRQHEQRVKKKTIIFSSRQKSASAGILCSTLWLSLFGVTSWHVYVALSGLKIDTPLCSAAAGDVGVVPLTDTGDQ